MPRFGAVELVLIMVIVTMLFGVGKLPEVFGSVGKGIREFRRNSGDLEGQEATTTPNPSRPTEGENTSKINVPVQDTSVH